MSENVSFSSDLRHLFPSLRSLLAQLTSSVAGNFPRYVLRPALLPDWSLALPYRPWIVARLFEPRKLNKTVTEPHKSMPTIKERYIPETMYILFDCANI